MESGRIGPFSSSASFLNASFPADSSCEINDILSVPEFRPEVVADLATVLLSHETEEVHLVGVRERLFEELRARWPTVNGSRRCWIFTIIVGRLRAMRAGLPSVHGTSIGRSSRSSSPMTATSERISSTST